MARFLYISDQPWGELQSERAGYHANGKAYIWIDGEKRDVTRTIELKPNPSRHECDARCYNATGRVMKCECSCGGVNHGRGGIATASESVTLADGRADQSLIPGVAAVPLTARQLAQERARREARRGTAGLPCGGLWDETAMNQGSLF